MVYIVFKLEQGHNYINCFYAFLFLSFLFVSRKDFYVYSWLCYIAKYP